LALLILALAQSIFLMSSLMLLLVSLIFVMVLIKLVPILGTISGKTVKLMVLALICLGNNFFFSSRRRHTICLSDWSSDVCSSDLHGEGATARARSSDAISAAVEARGTGLQYDADGLDSDAILDVGAVASRSGEHPPLGEIGRASWREKG